MSNEVVKADTGEIVQGSSWSREQIDLLKRTYAKGATDDELKLYEYQCERTGLDPFKRQIYFRKQKGNQVLFITAIDGYRSVADKTGLYAGSDDYLYDDGLIEYHHIKSGRGPYPETATVTVYKIVGGHRVGFTATVRWQEYFPGEAQGFMWKKMPYLMLGKCGEALALRKAFPQELGGIYTKDEMDQAQMPAWAPPTEEEKKTNAKKWNTEIKPVEVKHSPPVDTAVKDAIDGLDGTPIDAPPEQPNNETFVEEQIKTIGDPDAPPGTYRVEVTGRAGYTFKDELQELGFDWGSSWAKGSKKSQRIQGIDYDRSIALKKTVLTMRDEEGKSPWVEIYKMETGETLVDESF